VIKIVLNDRLELAIFRTALNLYLDFAMKQVGRHAGDGNTVDGVRWQKNYRCAQNLRDRDLRERGL